MGIPGVPDSALSYRSFKGYPDDRCYATTTFMGETIGRALDPSKGGNSFGLVNSIVRIPVYDWDQDNIQPAVSSSSGSIDKVGESAVGAAKPVGYVEKFRFKVAPVPNLMWLHESVLRPYYANDYIPASPLMYAQAAALTPSGDPSIPIIRNFLGGQNKGNTDLFNPNNGAAQDAIDNYKNNSDNKTGDGSIKGQLDSVNDSLTHSRMLRIQSASLTWHVILYSIQQA